MPDSYSIIIYRDNYHYRNNFVVHYGDIGFTIITQPDILPILVGLHNLRQWSSARTHTHMHEDTHTHYTHRHTTYTHAQRMHTHTRTIYTHNTHTRTHARTHTHAQHTRTTRTMHTHVCTCAHTTFTSKARPVLVKLYPKIMSIDDVV